MTNRTPGHGRAAAPKQKNRKARLFVKTFLLTLAVCAAALVVAGGVFLATIKPPEVPALAAAVTESTAAPPDATVTPVNNDPAFLPPEGNEEDKAVGGGLTAPAGFTDSDRKDSFYTFVIVGLDGGINTDTIMVASYDAANKQASIISIPRDSLVDVKRNVKKINAAYPAGTLNGGGQQGGIAQLKREIKTIIGFTPDYYVCIDLDAFVKIIDAVGGVDVDVPFAMKYDDPDQNLHIDLQAGFQHLDGLNAMGFARFRKGDNGVNTVTDYQRIDNQQTVIKAVLGKLLTPASIAKIPQFITIFSENVTTDLTAQNMLWFANQIKDIQGTDALSTYTMPTTGTSGPPSYYEYLDKPAILDLVNRTINPFTKDITGSDVDIVGG